MINYLIGFDDFNPETIKEIKQNKNYMNQSYKKEFDKYFKNICS